MTLSIIHLELSIAHLFLDIYWVQLLSTIIILYNWLLYPFSFARTGMNYLFKQLEYRIKEESVLMVNVCWNPSKCLFLWRLPDQFISFAISGQWHQKSNCVFGKLFSDFEKFQSVYSWIMAGTEITCESH